MRVIWTDPALSDLAEIREFIEQRDPEAAVGVALRLVEISDLLTDQPRMGVRVGFDDNKRKLIVGGTPYILYYEIRGRVIEIASVRNARRSR